MGVGVAQQGVKEGEGTGNGGSGSGSDFTSSNGSVTAQPSRVGGVMWRPFPSSPSPEEFPVTDYTVLSGDWTWGGRWQGNKEVFNPVPEPSRSFQYCVRI